MQCQTVLRRSVQMMPELRTESTVIDHLNLHVSNMDFSSLPDIGNIATTRSPLPLQCLAADALPDSVKQEIEDVTNSSLQECSSPQQHSSNSVSLENGHTVTVPLQFFTDRHGLRIVGGIHCKYSGVRHAQIVCLKHLQEENTGSIIRRLELLTSLHDGLCVTEINGQSLKDTTYEHVKKVMKSIHGAFITLVVRDCRDHSNHCSLSVSKAKLSIGSKEQPTHFLTLRKRGKLSTSKTSLQAENIARESLEMSVECKLEPSNVIQHETLKVRKASSEDNTIAPNNTEEIKNTPNGVAKISLRYIKSQSTLCINLHKFKHHSKILASDNMGIFLNTCIFPDTRCQGIKSCRMLSSTISTESLLDQSASYSLTQEEIEETSIRIIIWDTNRSKKPHFRGEAFLKLNNHKFVNLEGVPYWYTICPPDKNLPPVPDPHITHTQETLMKKWAVTAQNLGTLTLRRIRKGDKGSNLKLAVSSQTLQDQPGTPEQALEKLSNLPTILKPLKDISSGSTSLRKKHKTSQNDNRNSRLSLYDLAGSPQATERLRKAPSTPNLAQDVDESPFPSQSMSLIEFLDTLNNTMGLAKVSHKLQDTVQTPGLLSQLVCDSDSSHSIPSSFGVEGRPTSPLSQTESDISSNLTTSSCKHLHGWSEEEYLDSHSIDINRNSLGESMEHMKTYDVLPNTKTSSLKTRAQKKDGFDHVLPSLHLNDAPIYILHSSTEAISPTCKDSQFLLDDTVCSSMRMSKSMGDLTLMGDDNFLESSLDISGLQRPSVNKLTTQKYTNQESHKTQRSISIQPLKSIDDNECTTRRRHMSVNDVLSDDLSADDKSSMKILPALVSQRKESCIGTVKKLTEAYCTGKPVGSVNLNVTAKYVSGTISLQVVDVVFFSNKLMNSDYVVKVNLFNRFNEECESSRKAYASLRKRGMHETKQLPQLFEFTGNPSVYFIQLLFQIRTRVFGSKLFQAFIDLKEDITNSQNTWFYLRKLHTN